MRLLSIMVMLLALAGCGSLPNDGPSGPSFSRKGPATAAYALVELNYAITQTIASRPAAALTGLASNSSLAPTDLIAEGDSLSVSVIEAGSGGLFARSPELSGGDSQQTLPRMIVDSNGDLVIPFAGAVHVGGLRPREASDAIRRALRGRAINPQVSVMVNDSRANSVSVIGEVRNAGHFPLSAHNDRLLDILASAGGPNKPPADLLVVVSRAGRNAQAPLAVLMADPAQNIRLAPQDQIRIISQPRKYSIFGAFLRDSQTLIEDDSLTLAGAISRAGGLDTNSANAAQVLVFRFERPEIAQALGLTTPAAAKGVPIIYRLNFRNPDGVFVADNFEVRSGDLLYVPRSNLTELQKFFTLINSVTQIGYNVRATGSIR